MATALTYVFFIIGLILIIKGGDIFVDSATKVANMLGVPKFIIGATIVSIATTLPEIIVLKFITSQPMITTTKLILKS